ncbi:TPR end-of-group domain-containing protein [Sphingosinicella terrae]|uniref:TPR end-of-group domain-containing protein n=1 Tax=Sphingosinicella terrae TaxID=2172047 RepID=UPI000E0DB2A7|nr:winged helix-turn-helix domain-containing protein [Sphingosinicella terrae]
MIIIGHWTFDPGTRRLLAGGEERRLSPKAAEVLQALSETAPQPWSRDALLERVWPGVFVGEEVLTHAVAELRRQLGDEFRDPVHIETIHKRGYRLKCPVEHPEIPAHGDRDSATELELDLYASYLEACELFDRGGTRNTSEAAALFASVSEAAPDFVAARVGLAKATAFLAIYYSPGSADLAAALVQCELARRGNPKSAEAHAAQGFVYAIGHQYQRALADFRKAVALDPQSSDVHYMLGRACFAELDTGLAAPMLERAAALREDDYHSLMLAGKARQMSGDDRRARSNFALAAARIRPRLEAFPDDFRAVCGLSRCLVHLGDLDSAAALLDRARDHSDPMNYHLACTYARAGESERALDTLEEVIAHGWNHGAWLDRDPDFDRIRDDARFRRIARTIQTH